MFYLKTLVFIDILLLAGLVLFRWALAPQHRELVSLKLGTLVLATPAVALFCGNIYLFYVYLAAIVAFNARSRTELAVNFLILLPLVPLLLTETGFAGVYLLALSAVLAMGLGALLGFLVTSGIRKPPGLGHYDMACAILVVMFMLVSNHDLNPTGLLRGFVTNLLAFTGPYLLVSRAGRNAVDVERLLLGLCIGGTITAVTACFQARWHWVVFETYYSSLHVPLPMLSGALSMRAGFLRTGGSMIDYSAGGLFMASIVTLLPLIRRAFRPIGFWAVLAIMVGGLIVSQSRGAWVAAVVGVVFIAAWRGHWSKAALMMGGAVAAEIAVLLFAKSGTLAQIGGQTEEASGTVDYRQRLFAQGLDQVRAHPLIGQSQTQLIANLSDLTQGQHIVDFVNAHLFVAMVGGIPTFLVWCWIWIMPVAASWRKRQGDFLLAAAPAAIIVPAMVALTFTSLIDRNLTWPVIALALAPACFAFRPGGKGHSTVRGVMLVPGIARQSMGAIPDLSPIDDSRLGLVRP